MSILTFLIAAPIVIAVLVYLCMFALGTIACIIYCLTGYDIIFGVQDIPWWRKV